MLIYCIEEILRLLNWEGIKRVQDIYVQIFNYDYLIVDL